MNDTVKKVEKPDDRLTVTIDNKPTELFMSAGLIRRLAAFCGGISAIESVFMDPGLEIVLMLEVLKPRTPRGQPAEPEKKTDAYSLDDFPMGTEDGDKVKKWIGGHLAYFFINGVLMLKENTEALQNSNPSLLGSQALDTTKASAGPSTASSAS